MKIVIEPCIVMNLAEFLNCVLLMVQMPNFVCCNVLNCAEEFTFSLSEWTEGLTQSCCKMDPALYIRDLFLLYARGVVCRYICCFERVVNRTCKVAFMITVCMWQKIIGLFCSE